MPQPTGSISPRKPNQRVNNLRALSGIGPRHGVHSPGCGAYRGRRVRTGCLVIGGQRRFPGQGLKPYSPSQAWWSDCDDHAPRTLGVFPPRGVPVLRVSLGEGVRTGGRSGSGWGVGGGVGGGQVMLRTAEFCGTETVTPPLSWEGGSELCMRCAASVATGCEITSCASVSRLTTATGRPTALC